MSSLGELNAAMRRIEEWAATNPLACKCVVTPLYDAEGNERSDAVFLRPCRICMPPYPSTEIAK